MTTSSPVHHTDQNLNPDCSCRCHNRSIQSHRLRMTKVLAANFDIDHRLWLIDWREPNSWPTVVMVLCWIHGSVNGSVFCRFDIMMIYLIERKQGTKWFGGVDGNDWMWYDAWATGIFDRTYIVRWKSTYLEMKSIKLIILFINRFSTSSSTYWYNFHFYVKASWYINNSLIL